MRVKGLECGTFGAYYTTTIYLRKTLQCESFTWHPHPNKMLILRPSNLLICKTPRCSIRRKVIALVHDLENKLLWNFMH
jgi:hypothetical protein